LGKDFKLKQWSDSWLKTRGVNMLEGIVTYTPDSLVQKFAVKQSVDKISNNQLREQVIDIAFYEADMKEHIIKNVVIKPEQEVTEVKVDIKKPIVAYQINHGDHTYAKVRYDARSIEAFKANMQLIKDPLVRSEIWNQMWYHINDEQMTSLDYVDFAIK